MYLFCVKIAAEQEQRSGSGGTFARRATLQARKFGAVISSVHEASGVSEPRDGGVREIGLADGQRVRGRRVVLASGADYRRLPAENADRFEGLGLYYAATHIEAQQCSEEDVVVVGGANSAGQAVVKLADHAREVHVVTRRPLEAAMSRTGVAVHEEAVLNLLLDDLRHAVAD